MQLAIYIECDGNLSPEQMRKIIHDVAVEARFDVVDKGIPAIDHAHELDTSAMPQVWNAQLCRHQ